jgi:hypothetical protein
MAIWCGSPHHLLRGMGLTKRARLKRAGGQQRNLGGAKAYCTLQDVARPGRGPTSSLRSGLVSGAWPLRMLPAPQREIRRRPPA